ncbi:MAG TPA: nitroreductase family protein [Gaiellales bacterium]
MLDLTPEQLLTTTRSVRRRLDLERPVDDATVTRCLEIAVQAPTSVNQQHWHFVVVTDPQLREAVASWYRRAWDDYAPAPLDEDPPEPEPPGAASSRHLARVLHRVPVHLIPCVEGRPEGQPPSELAALYGSVIQASWSFQLAARLHGLGSVFTTYHLDYEREVAELLGIPFDRITQVGLIPVAHAVGTEFRPAKRRPVADVVHRDRW